MLFGLLLLVGAVNVSRGQSGGYAGMLSSGGNIAPQPGVPYTPLPDPLISFSFDPSTAVGAPEPSSASLLLLGGVALLGLRCRQYACLVALLISVANYGHADSSANANTNRPPLRTDLAVQAPEPSSASLLLLGGAALLALRRRR